MSYAVIGDTHGCYKTLLALIKKIPKEDKIIFVGDLVDRGPSSKEVVQLVINKGYDCVQGNHDWWISHLNAKNIESWLDVGNGGSETLKSYGDIVPFGHIEFLGNLPLYKIYDEKLLVTHSSAATVWPVLRDSEKVRQSIQWNHVRFITPEPIPGLFNVFGHTKKAEPVILPHCAMIDTGAGYGHKLTALRWPSMEIIQQENLDLCQ